MNNEYRIYWFQQGELVDIVATYESEPRYLFKVFGRKLRETHNWLITKVIGPNEEKVLLSKGENHPECRTCSRSAVVKGAMPSVLVNRC